MQDEKILLELARLILPSGFVENFKITSIISNDIDVEISLDEFENLPEERKGHKLGSPANYRGNIFLTQTKH